MTRTYNVAILPEVYDFLDDLAQTLLEKEYVSWIEHGEKIVDDIIDYIKTLPYSPHYNLNPIADKYFSKYGKELQYTFFKRKTSKQTTWYIFFSRQANSYIVHYITNNHKDGKYIREALTEED